MFSFQSRAAQTDGRAAWSEMLEYSTYVQAAAAADPTINAWLAADAPTAPTLSLSKSLKTVEAFESALRNLRRQVMLHTMHADFAGAPFASVVGAITQFAAFCVPSAQLFHAQILQKSFGKPDSALITVGMGKLGGEELNVSSDIDLIYVFPEDGETAHARANSRISQAAYFAKLAAASAASLDSMTAEGFVFRVDTRLRPYGDEGPLAVSIDFLEQYFFEQARFWERLAWLRSASMTGDTAARQRLRDLVRPFVFRRYLDFDAYSGLRELHGKIRAEGFRSGGESNVKLGRGGIRELEFFVQVQQLVRGGRDASLQQRTTIPAIDALERAGVLQHKQAAGLRAAYPFLRRLEHFLQYQNDAQTQTLPTVPSAQLALARALGYTSIDGFFTALNAVRSFVAAQFDNLSQAADGESAPKVQSTPKTAFFVDWPDAEEAQRYFSALTQSQRFVALPEASRNRLQVLFAALPAACGHTRAPLATLKRWGQLLEAICGRSSYLALLAEHPALLAPVSRVLAASGWAADYLRDHPILLDELLDARARTEPFSPANAYPQLRAQLSATTDTEAQLDALRRFQQTEQFRVLLRDLDDDVSVEALADDLSALADVCVRATAETLWAQLAPGAPFPAFAVIAYGRWGGKELGYGSDLDLVFVVGDDVRFDLCAKLAQRLQSWLTTTTTAGQLYEIDTRLRPDGDAGLLLTPISAFASYQQNKAWTWEHQALSRARFAVGDETIGRAFESIRAEILRSQKVAPKVQTEVREMRERMRGEKANKQPGFDVKNDAGGMVDIEFIVQFIVLLHAGANPYLIENKGNIALLEFSGDIGLLRKADAHGIADAYRNYRAFQHQSRLAGAEKAVAEANAFIAERAAVSRVWAELLG